MPSSWSAFRTVLAVVVTFLGVLPTGGTVQATEYFSDDFEGYLDDTELTEVGGWQILEVNTPNENAAWTVLNPGGRGNPPTEDGTPSLGNFLISDSDAAANADVQGSGMSHDIWSRTFSCAGATKVWLHMDCTAQLNNNGLVIFDVDVSTDGGTSWTNAFRRIAPSRTLPPLPAAANTDGFFGRLHVDITALAANKPSVMFRLRQFEPEDDWWIAVDDVVVDDQAPPSGGAVNLLVERFGSGIPGTWTVRSDIDPPNTDTKTWNTDDMCQRSNVRFNAAKIPHQDGHGMHRLDAGYAIMDSECIPASPADEYLITPVLDCTKATGVFLHFSSEVNVSTQTVQQVLLSLDGGNTFEEPAVFSYTYPDPVDPALLVHAGFDTYEEPFYGDFVFSVPTAAGKSRVAFAFHQSYMTPPQADDPGYWAVDNVKVTADGNGLPVRNCANREFVVSPFDPATSSVNMTWRSIAGDGGFRILGNGQQVGGDLPATATSFTDTNPPAGGSVAYSLQTLVGGAVEFECAAPAVSVISCPRDLSCCVNQAAKTVTLTWKNGVNLDGTGYRLLRNGVPVKTVALTVATYTDSTLPGPGSYDYQLVLNGGNPAQCPGLPLKCRANVLGADLVFYDDFDCYVSDAALTSAGWEIHEEGAPSENAAWTTTDPGVRGNPPTADGTPTQGKFIISDSDAAHGDDHQGTGRSHDIWTPSLNCAGKNTVWLHAACTLVFNNNGECVFDVDVSTDGGASWDNAFRRVAPARSKAGYIANCLAIGGTQDDCEAMAELTPLPLADIPDGFDNGPQIGNADGFFGSLDVNLSALAGNKPNVKVRFRQFEPSDDWWMELDNVLIDTTPVSRGSRRILGPEDFADGIPGDWPISSDPGTAPWFSGDPCLISLLGANGGTFPDAFDGRGLHHFDDHFAIVGADETCSTPAGNETLATPTVDCSGTTAVYLHFKSDLLATDAIAEVLLSLDGGATFDTANPVFSYDRGGSLLRDPGNAEVIYNEHTLAVPQAVDQKKVAFAFHYMNSAGRVAFWAIDDVEVTADGGGVVKPRFHRGDADDNGQLQLTDAVRILNVLFLGTGVITCNDAADADDNGQVQLTDAVRILNVLFLGTGTILPPGAPPEACGEDPTTDGAADLGCVSYTHC